VPVAKGKGEKPITAHIFKKYLDEGSNARRLKKIGSTKEQLKNKSFS
jgi:hypothetical protein